MYKYFKNQILDTFKKVFVARKFFLGKINYSVEVFNLLPQSKLHIPVK